MYLPCPRLWARRNSVFTYDLTTLLTPCALSNSVALADPYRFRAQGSKMRSVPIPRASIFLYILAVVFFGSIASVAYGQPRLVRDINPANSAVDFRVGSSHPNHFASAGGKLFFRAHPEGFPTTQDASFWTSDGTANGTREFFGANFRPPYFGPSPVTVDFEGKLFFSLWNEPDGIELWSSDGTPEGTMLIKDIRSQDGESGGSRPWSFYRVGNQFVFNADDGVHGRELWMSDGTHEGTKLLRDIQPGPGSGASSHPGYRYSPLGGLPLPVPIVERAAVLDDRLVFAADDGIHGEELWVTDLTTAGTVLLADIRIGPESSRPEDFVIAADQAYFVVEGPDGCELWVTDGSSAGTILLTRIGRENGETHLISDGKRVFFSPRGHEVWVTDSSEGATSPYFSSEVSDFLAERGENFAVIAARGGQVFCVLASVGIWASDGSLDGTYQLGTSAPHLLIEAGDWIVIGSRNEIWLTNGTRESTRHYELSAGWEQTGPPCWGSQQNFCQPWGLLVGDMVYLKADDGEHGYELWALPLPDSAAAPFLRGDCNADGEVNVSDARCVLSKLRGTPPRWGWRTHDATARPRDSRPASRCRRRW